MVTINLPVTVSSGKGVKVSGPREDWDVQNTVSDVAVFIDGTAGAEK